MGDSQKTGFWNFQAFQFCECLSDQPTTHEIETIQEQQQLHLFYSNVANLGERDRYEDSEVLSRHQQDYSEEGQGIEDEAPRVGTVLSDRMEQINFNELNDEEEVIDEQEQERDQSLGSKRNRLEDEINPPVQLVANFCAKDLVESLGNPIEAQSLIKKLEMLIKIITISLPSQTGEVKF
eukprot:TRINITY_DN14406_c0_g1_i1.p1 TRINITY_DN14406_c0_g1~~TRINITY_DN14406_c0_g1_i1.p1  ORF type:complete len:180 (+),score=35.32 TRINITY_DN14406_c0_g1_i1:88-627(+)